MKIDLLTVWTRFHCWRQSHRGQTLVEYTLIIMLVGAVLFVLLGVLGDPLKSFFGRVTTTLATGY